MFAPDGDHSRSDLSQRPNKRFAQLDENQRSSSERFQPDGTSWLTRDHVGGDSEEMIGELTLWLQAQKWERAAMHRCGAGLDDQNGTCCLEIMRFMMKRSRNEDEGLDSRPQWRHEVRVPKPRIA